MNANRVIIIIMVILVALALLSVLSKFTMKREPQPVTTAAATVEKTVAKINAPVAKKVAEKETIIIKEKEEVVGLLTAKGSKPFWGNRGYLIKAGKSTFIKLSVLEQLKKMYEAEEAGTCRK